MTSKSRPSQESDVIDVRSDERFDQEKLQDYLGGRIVGSDQVLTVRQFGGGHANLTYLLQFGQGPDSKEYVLRRPPLGPVAPGSHDMKREFRALSVLWKEFPVAPKALLLCEDPEILGCDFFVMKRLGGIVVRKTIPPEFGNGRDPIVNRKLSEVTIDTLVDFHRVDPVSIGLDKLGKPDGFLQRQVQGWTDRYERCKTHGSAVAEDLSRWLIDHLPTSPHWTLLHNDWRLDNMAVDPDDPGRCVAVYDWDMCTVGDPLCDLGTLLCSWFDPGEEIMGPGSMPSQTNGFMNRKQAIARYGERSGTDIQTMDYYQVFGVFKMAVVVQQIYFRYHEGQTQDRRFARMGEDADRMMKRAASMRP